MKKVTPPDKKKPAGNINKPPFNWAWVYVTILLYLILSPLLSEKMAKETTWQQFSTKILSRKAVAKLEVINKERVDVYIKSSFSKDTAFKEVFKPVFGNGLYHGPHYTFNIGSVETFEHHLDEAEQAFSPAEHIPVSYVTESNWLLNLLSWVVPFVLLFFLWNYLMRRARGVDGHGRQRYLTSENRRLS
ncbi:hypothetical protein [Mucilaginibacter sp. AK015]|uniref:hypothetical protein n=1 Tax=Mucilaginibacter sp. AK015 TaxID=2723072 RepID=UPI001616EAE5|nr:hypothetical protein [Mucilaginibacter sp. AK015]MBB5396847.1 ATP-dependent Zn protease [Mucilaginibacter sp. AK015]